MSGVVDGPWVIFSEIPVVRIPLRLLKIWWPGAELNADASLFSLWLSCTLNNLPVARPLRYVSSKYMQVGSIVGCIVG